MISRGARLSDDTGLSDEPKLTVCGMVDNLPIDKPRRSDQFMVTRCVVREVAGLCAQQSYKARHDVTEEVDGKLQQAMRRGSDWRPDLKLVLWARWQRAEAIDGVQLWCTGQLIEVRWRFSGCSGVAESDGKLTGSRWSSSLWSTCDR
jgi:hypothetical protein